MRFELIDGRHVGGYVSVGSCWKPGEMTATDFTAEGEKGNALPLLSETAAFWPDGSAKWIRHTFSSELAGSWVEIKSAKAQPPYEDIAILDCPEGKRIQAGRLSLTLPNAGSRDMARDVCVDGQKRISAIYPLLKLESREHEGEIESITVFNCLARIDKVDIEAAKDRVCAIKYEGVLDSREDKMPFSARMLLGADSLDIRYEFTFFYDGNPAKDFVNGLGLVYLSVLQGAKYNRHIKLATDREVFHEEAMYIKCEHPRTPRGLAEKQNAGQLLSCVAGSAEGAYIAEVYERLPVWRRYILNQPNELSYVVSKQTHRECSAVRAMSGRRAPGALALGSENGTLLVGIKDFWQLYPAALEADDIDADEAFVTAWFKSPFCEALDFGHYDTRAYRFECNEGFSEPDPRPQGIAFTCECYTLLTDGLADDEALCRFASRTQKPAVYMEKPEYYHDKRAFGYWSLPGYDTPAKRLLEEQMAAAVEFYKSEIENRGWYGLLDYGDIMHTFDSSRHKWFYDFGGWAWQNTELVPTYWLWLYFLRTGREDVYTLAEAMSRHCSETDCYHFGPYKGLGSRHNVRHWGCPCKEPRIGMAGHHRPMYYLVGDRRIGDCMHEAVSAAGSWANGLHSYRDVDGTKHLAVRTGPDWASFLSNWMTEYERTLSEAALSKIQNGINGIASAPMGLGSGPHFAFEPESGRMEYIGEFTENIHLSVCMGEPQVYLEAIDALGSEELKKLVRDYGKLYSMSDEERREHFGSMTEGKEFSMNCLTAAIALVCSYLGGDPVPAQKGWRALADSSPLHRSDAGFKPEKLLAVTSEGKKLYEIEWISTGYVAQWCLSIMLALELCPDSVPEAQLFGGIRSV